MKCPICERNLQMVSLASNPLQFECWCPNINCNWDGLHWHNRQNPYMPITQEECNQEYRDLIDEATLMTENEDLE